MTPEEFQTLADKAENGTLSKEEELSLLQELNKGFEALQEFIKAIKAEKN